jgi:hypothetical protein
VEIFAPVDQVTLAPGQSAALTLRVRVAPGHHINSAVPVAAEPGDAAHAPGLVGLRAAIHGGTGVRVFADYPAGEPPEHDPALRVHHGEFDLPLVLERPAEGEPDAAWTGRPLLVVTFQACTGRACLLPSRVELDIAIDRA